MARRLREHSKQSDLFDVLSKRAEPEKSKDLEPCIFCGKAKIGNRIYVSTLEGNNGPADVVCYERHVAMRRERQNGEKASGAED